jgi:hypothetical protein
MGRSAPIPDVDDRLYGVFYPDQPNDCSHNNDPVGSDTKEQIDHGPPADHGVVGEAGATRPVTPTKTLLRRSCMARTSYARSIRIFFVIAAVAALLLPAMITGGSIAFAQGPAAGAQPKYGGIIRLAECEPPNLDLHLSISFMP